MSSDFIQIIQTFPALIWSLLTSFTIPGLNFTPATMMFGILSFGVAIKFVTGIIDITGHGFEATTVAEHKAMKKAKSKGKS